MNKKLIVGAVAATALTLGSGAAIAAQQAPEATKDDTKQEEQEPSYKGSISAPEDKAAESKSGGEENEAAEAQQLQKLAKINQADAERAALSAVPGTVKGAELGNENGYVVWEIEVAGKDGKLVEVKVDAGNGQVLHREAEDSGESEKGEDRGAGQNEPNEAPESGETTG